VEIAIGEDGTVHKFFDGADAAFNFRHVLVLIAAFQVYREILPQRLKFRVPVDTSDLEATVGVDSGNAVDAHQKVPTGVRAQELNGAKPKVL
jgi:hypothetical protein